MPSPLPSKREILVFEPDVEGHSQEWLQHLVDFVAANDQAAAIAVLAPPALCATLSRSMPPVADGRVRFIAMKPREVRLCGHRSLALAAFARWWVMRQYLQRSGADMGLFLCLDLLSLPLAFGLRTHGKPLAGILFRPSVHYAAFGNYRPGFGEWLRDVRKDLLYRMMLRNPAVATILSLDPFFPTHAADRYRHGGKVQALPDPAHPAADSDRAVASADVVPPGRIAFLLFGYLFATLISIGSVLQEEITYRRYGNWRDVARLIAFCFLEHFPYRQMHMWWRLKGTIQFLRGDVKWQPMRRVGFQKS